MTNVKTNRKKIKHTAMLYDIMTTYRHTAVKYSKFGKTLHLQKIGEWVQVMPKGTAV